MTGEATLSVNCQDYFLCQGSERTSLELFDTTENMELRRNEVDRAKGKRAEPLGPGYPLTGNPQALDEPTRPCFPLYSVTGIRESPDRGVDKPQVTNAGTGFNSSVSFTVHILCGKYVNPTSLVYFHSDSVSQWRNDHSLTTSYVLPGYTKPCGHDSNPLRTLKHRDGD